MLQTAQRDTQQMRVGKRRRRAPSATVGLLIAAGLVALAPSAAADAASTASATITADASPTGVTTIVNQLSNKCADTADSGRANGTPLQQWACYPGSANQTWNLQATDSDYVKITVDDSPNLVVDLENAVANQGTIAHLWGWYGGSSQQWRPAKISTGVYELRSRVNDNMCLAPTAQTTADGGRLSMTSCTGASAQRWLIPGGTTTPPTSGAISNPFGSNVKVIDPTWSQTAITSTVLDIYNAQYNGNTVQFSDRRDAVIFAPGTYNADVPVGFNTQILGAGKLPGDVTINGHVRTDSTWMTPNASDGSQYNGTQNFWRAAENLTVNPTGGQEMWAVSQAAPLRRVQINGSLILATPRTNGQPGCGYTSGGFMSDSRVTGTVDSCSQQQWYTRNSQIGSWQGKNWNMMFQGVTGAPAEGVWWDNKYTVENSTPVVREKPFVYVEAGQWKVFVPSLRTNSSGTSWGTGSPQGETQPISNFYITKNGDTADTINAQLSAGKNLVVTPGIYSLNKPIKVDRANTVILGLGFATLRVTNGNSAIQVADVDGVKIAGLLLDAGQTKSANLLQVGASKTGVSHASNPTSLHDVFIRIGGKNPANVDQAVVINSNNVIGDHLWIWLADHGDHQPTWSDTTGRNGLVVNGDNVTMLGLFVEHFQQYQTMWNGQNGKTFFYQNETPYFVPTQAAWMNGSKNGWPAYKVADNVTSHQAAGLGSYGVFFTSTWGTPSFVGTLYTAFEVPQSPGVTMRHMVTTSITQGNIRSVINGTGGGVTQGQTSYINNYPY